MECEWHPGQDAMMTCMQCGKNFCGVCLEETRDTFYCPDCHAEHVSDIASKMTTGAPATRVKRERRRGRHAEPQLEPTEVEQVEPLLPAEPEVEAPTEVEPVEPKAPPEPVKIEAIEVPEPTAEPDKVEAVEPEARQEPAEPEVRAKPIVVRPVGAPPPFAPPVEPKVAAPGVEPAVAVPDVLEEPKPAKPVREPKPPKERKPPREPKPPKPPREPKLPREPKPPKPPKEAKPPRVTREMKIQKARAAEELPKVIIPPTAVEELPTEVPAAPPAPPPEVRAAETVPAPEPTAAPAVPEPQQLSLPIEPPQEAEIVIVPEAPPPSALEEPEVPRAPVAGVTEVEIEPRRGAAWRRREPKPPREPKPLKPLKEPKPPKEPRAAKPLKEPKPTKEPRAAKPPKEPKPTKEPRAAKPPKEPKPPREPRPPRPPREPKPAKEKEPRQARVRKEQREQKKLRRPVEKPVETTPPPSMSEDEKVAFWGDIDRPRSRHRHEVPAFLPLGEQQEEQPPVEPPALREEPAPPPPPATEKPEAVIQEPEPVERTATAAVTADEDMAIGKALAEEDEAIGAALAEEEQAAAEALAGEEKEVLAEDVLRVDESEEVLPPDEAEIKDHYAPRLPRRADAKRERPRRQKATATVVMQSPEEYEGAVTSRPAYLKAVLFALLTAVILAGAYAGFEWWKHSGRWIFGWVIGFSVGMVVVFMSGRHFSWKLGLISTAITWVSLCLGQLVFAMLDVRFNEIIPLKLPFPTLVHHGVNELGSALSSPWLIMFLLSGLVAFLVSFRPWPVTLQVRPPDARGAVEDAPDTGETAESGA